MPAASIVLESNAVIASGTSFSFSSTRRAVTVISSISWARALAGTPTPAISAVRMAAALPALLQICFMSIVMPCPPRIR